MARSILLMGLRHAVITSVTRDDLADGGAAHWARVIEAIREASGSTVRAEAIEAGRASATKEMREGCGGTTVEVLIPDLGGRTELLDVVLAARPDIVGHNIETVRRLTPGVRSKASYEVSLGVLRYVAAQGAVAKSGIMLGLGETPDEVLEALDDLREAGVSIVTLGQYLRPSMAHVAVAEYVTPSMFDFYRQEALARGFSHVASGPLVRSSYMAEQALDGLTRRAV